MKKLKLKWMMLIITIGLLSSSSLAWSGVIHEYDLFPRCEPASEIVHTIISKVKMDEEAKYFCQALDHEKWFACDDLSPFADGSVVAGLKVKLELNTVDMCKKPGACGSRACYTYVRSVGLDVVCSASF